MPPIGRKPAPQPLPASVADAVRTLADYARSLQPKAPPVVLIVAYLSDGPDADFAFSVADTKSGQSWSPSKAAFAAAPPDELTPMSRDASPNRKGVRYGFLPSFPDPPAPGQYLVFVHPAAGGPPVGPPLVVAADAGPRQLSLAVAF